MRCSLREHRTATLPPTLTQANKNLVKLDSILITKTLFLQSKKVNMTRLACMIQKLIGFLKQPFPYFHKKWQVVGLPAVCVAVVLTIVMSFGNKPVTVYGFALFVGGLTTVSMLCAFILIYIIPKISVFRHCFDKEKWTKGKYFLFSFILTTMVATANAIYFYIITVQVYQRDVELSAFLYRNFSLTFLVGIIPVAIGYFWSKYHGLHSDLRKKEEQNKKLLIRVPKSVPDEKLITLSGNTKDSLTLFPQELIYLESSDNHVQIFYKVKDKISQKTLRATLQQMEELLSDYPSFVRCHRAFIVNVYQIEKVKGFKLWLKSTETEIPISKTNKANLQKQMECVDYLPQI